MDKYEELYSLSKYLLNHEIDRHKRIDDKASKYLAVITLLVGIYGFFANWMLSEVVPIQQWDFLEWILALVILSVLLSLFITWVMIFRSLKVIELKQIPMNDQMIKFFDKNRPIDIWYALARGNKDALLENRKEVNRKAEQVSTGYKWTAVTVVLFFLLVSLFGYYKVERCNKQSFQQDRQAITAKRNP
ncbi:hypothetical protein ACFL2Q_01010 [Thermodesulfobacteriota bacterium]